MADQLSLALLSSVNQLRRQASLVPGLMIGSLTLLSQTDEQKRRRLWSCQCICGNKVISNTSNLMRYKSNSCTCAARAHLRASHLKHGQTHSDEHRSWTEMRKRCTNPKHRAYPRYGGRGITIDPRWDVQSSLIF